MDDLLRGRGWLSGLFLLLITALGAYLRLAKIDSLPPAAGYDAAQYGLDALQILDGARPLFLPANFGREVLFSYLVAAVYSLSEPGTTGIFVSSALVGVATIPAVYLAARVLWTDESPLLRNVAPLLAALVTAVSYWHLNYSRAGLRVIWVPLFAALITAALWHGLQRGRRWSLAAAGLLLGLSQYTYQAARLLPLLVAAGFLFTYAARRRFARQDALDLLLTFGLAALVFLPLGRYALQQPQIFNDRLRQTALLDQGNQLSAQIAAVGAQAGAALRMFFIEGDHEPLYTIPGRPSLNPFLAAFFLLGLGIAAWRWKQPVYLYLLAWLVLMTAPAMIADQAATAKRALGAMPAAAIIISLGMAMPWAWLAHRRRRWAAWAFATLLVVGLLWTTALTFQDYFQRWGNDPSLAAHYQRDHTEIGLAAAAVPRDEPVLISPFSAAHPAIQLLSQRHPGLRSYDGHRCLLLPLATAGLTYLIVPGETERSIAQLQAIYPGGELSSGPLRPDREAPYFDRFRVSPGAVPALNTPSQPLLIWQDGLMLLDVAIQPAEARPGDTVAVTLTYRALREPGHDYTAFVHVRPMTTGGVGEAILTQADSEPCGGALQTSAWREGDIIRDRVDLVVAEDAAPGTYAVVTGFYRWPDLTSLALEQGENGMIGQLTVR